jgi:hypothetical protein
MSKSAENSPSPVRPFWIPPDLKVDQLSPAMQLAIAQILNPAYEELVVLAQSEIERSMGLTHVHLLWHELIQQIDLAKDMGQTLPKGEGTEAHQEKLVRHMRLISQKDKAARFLLEVQKFYHRVGEIDPLKRLSR